MSFFLIVLIASVQLSTARNCTNSLPVCKNGLLLPRWNPVNDISAVLMIFRSLVYFVSLCYLFLGVSVASDRFMTAIEAITSREKEVKVVRPNGEIAIVYCHVWNETVANLTLMALGSSAPEIFLSVIEICGNNFQAGDLGPGTIVGSAAFNLLIIVAICVMVVPSSEVRRIRQIAVFWVTVFWSIFAYIWLYLIIAVISAGVIELWEGILTFLFFPLTVLTSYWADKGTTGLKLWMKRILPANSVTPESSQSLGNVERMVRTMINETDPSLDTDRDEIKAFESSRENYIQMFKDIRKRRPEASIEELEGIILEEIYRHRKRSKAFFYVLANQRHCNAELNLSRRAQTTRQRDFSTGLRKKRSELVPTVFFQPCHYNCREEIGTVYLTAVCQRPDGPQPQTIYVDYTTQDGTARQKQNYLAARGTLIFGPTESQQQIGVEIVDNEVFEDDMSLFVILSNARVKPLSGMMAKIASVSGRDSGLCEQVKLKTPNVATIIILDNDRSGIFEFPSEKMEICESVREALLKVIRVGGYKGRIRVPYRIFDGTAKSEIDYKVVAEELTFNEDQTESFIKVVILSSDQSRKGLHFTVALEEPQLDQTESPGSAHTATSLGIESNVTVSDLVITNTPSLGAFRRCKVHFTEDLEVTEVVDSLIDRARLSFVIGTSSWKEQLLEAIKIVSDSNQTNNPSRFDYLTFWLAAPWNLTFALIPPTDYLGGWATFFTSIVCIAVLTAVIGDLASHFGCTVGLKDSVTAISFVALGTSLPDTFASKVAALNDDCADSSIGNVTGSNAVNVYLGIGVAWLLAAVYHSAVGTQFLVDPGSLAFSVTTFCVAAAICIALLQFRRFYKPVGGELGGPQLIKRLTSVACVLLWAAYILLAALEAYCIIEGF